MLKTERKRGRQRILRVLVLIASLGFEVAAHQQVPKATQPEGLKERIGTIIIAPGSGPSIALPDFQPRSPDLSLQAQVFNRVLWDDLDFARVASLVGKSLYPVTLLPDPLSLKSDEWAADPVRADYVAFGNLTGSNDRLSASCFLYDVKTRQPLLTRVYEGENRSLRSLAHQFADEIAKLLYGMPGVASSKVAFRSGREIYLMDYDGYNVRRISNEGALTLLPNLSPDGSKVAYVSYASGFPNIQVRATSDGLPYGFPRFTSGTTSSPVFSPDGAQLAFASSKDSNAMEIYVSNTGGSSIRRLTYNDGIIDTSPRWNPKTGREIAFVSDRSGSPQLFVMDADGGNVRRLLTAGGQADTPAWSPDGRYIAYTWRPSSDSQFNIYVMDIASGQIVQLTDHSGSNEAPAWAPDGRHLVFQSNRTGAPEIWAMHIDGSDQRRLTNSGGRTPSWSR